ncbi:hypothetical protein J6590_030911 [Homalodisca vitripennis]|nr:hypothetical protein J6590_030911 [Homalodisca vitripennis]
MSNEKTKVENAAAKFHALNDFATERTSTACGAAPRHLDLDALAMTYSVPDQIPHLFLLGVAHAICLLRRHLLNFHPVVEERGGDMNGATLALLHSRQSG